VPDKLKIVHDLREGMDAIHSDYPNFLTHCFAGLVGLLGSVPPVFDAPPDRRLEELPEFRLRKLAVEVLQRLPHSEPFRAYAPTLCDALLAALGADNQENAQQCLKALVALHRSYHKAQLAPPLDQKAIQFVDAVIAVRF
jgi:hypothetical protein